MSVSASPKLAAVSRALFLAVMISLIVGNVFAFLHFQSPKNPYGPLRVRPSDELADVSPFFRLVTYYRLQQEMRGARLVVPHGVSVRRWAWEHVALVHVELDDAVRAVKRHSTAALRDRVVAKRLVGDWVCGKPKTSRSLLFLVKPSTLRGERAYLLPSVAAPGVLETSELFVTSEDGLKELERHLR